MSNSSDTKNWYKDWFNTPWYHILYKHRDDREAQVFIDNLVAFLSLTGNDKVLDMACGRGRHAIYLNSKGMDVTGVDLSEESIAYARKHENSRLQFDVHDMRRVYRETAYDYVFNLFTSFGYFDDDEDNVRAVQAMAASLKPGGVLVLDFLNTDKVARSLKPADTVQSEGLTFHIQRKIQEGFIVKDIRFEAEGRPWHFSERVKMLRKTDFLRYFRRAGLEPEHLFGGYGLSVFDAEASDRMIFICRKAG